MARTDFPRLQRFPGRTPLVPLPSETLLLWRSPDIRSLQLTSTNSRNVNSLSTRSPWDSRVTNSSSKPWMTFDVSSSERLNPSRSRGQLGFVPGAETPAGFGPEILRGIPLLPLAGHPPKRRRHVGRSDGGRAESVRGAVPRERATPIPSRPRPPRHGRRDPAGAVGPGG